MTNLGWLHQHGDDKCCKALAKDSNPCRLNSGPVDHSGPMPHFLQNICGPFFSIIQLVDSADSALQDVWSMCQRVLVGLIIYMPQIFATLFGTSRICGATVVVFQNSARTSTESAALFEQKPGCSEVQMVRDLEDPKASGTVGPMG